MTGSQALAEAMAVLRPYRVLMLSVVGDRRRCESCTLRPLCPYAASAGECTVSDIEPAQGVWTSKFASGSTESLEDGLSEVLSLQAKRVQALVDAESNLPTDTPAADRLKYSIETDKQIDKLFKNGMSLLTSKKPRPVQPRQLPPKKEKEPEVIEATPMAELTGPAMADAINEMVEAGIKRENISLSDVRDWVNRNAPAALEPADEVF